jgi:hypothetical protein
MSTLQVENLIGPTSGSNANKVIIPSGQTLDASNGFIPPAGSVVQQASTSSYAISTTSTSAVSTGLSIAFTPKYNNSKLIVNLQGGRPWNAVHNVQLDLKMYKDNIFQERIGSFYSQSSSIHLAGVNLHYEDTITSTTTKTYEVYMQSNNGGIIYLNESASSTIKIYMTIEEIAQ